MVDEAQYSKPLDKEAAVALLKQGRGAELSSRIAQLRVAIPNYQLDLSEADMSNLRLDSVDFSHIILEGANFDGSTLKNMHFHKTNMQDCSFRGAKISNCNFQKCNMMGSDFTETKFIENNRFKATDLSESTLSRTDVEGADFSHARMRDVEGVIAFTKENIYNRSEKAGFNLESANVFDGAMTDRDLKLIPTKTGINVHRGCTYSNSN